ncbi:MAG: hypothetical protein IH944_10270 [Armatimonadetes bacterium]|nr:hypothetical protein [Armatimonadota bacterium]
MTWTVDYGAGPQPVELPHAWRQDVPVAWEGPAVYRTVIDVKDRDIWLVFDGVSYRAEVSLDGAPALVHDGLWDAFAVSLAAHAGKTVEVTVKDTKNGGKTFPVKDVLSGFIPYVYHAFGGIYGDVRLVRSPIDPTEAHLPAPDPRVSVDGQRLFLDGKPFYMRGVLSWGWYPELGHMNPAEEAIRAEIRTAKQLGFNTIKFCLWVPRHRFFEILEEEGMCAWLELPLWDPTDDLERQAKMEREVGRIVRQYRHHGSIIAWTVGCELSGATGHEFRRRLVEMVQRETGCPLVKDNSGGAEMYGGDLREYGTFDDFHPYCDTHFYPAVLDSLRAGARKKRPILLGEYNDFDVHRDLHELRGKSPFWTSLEPDLNDVGVRWQHDLPSVLEESRWTREDNAALTASSRKKGAWVRRRVSEHVRSVEDIAGTVVAGWRHTPISTSGMVDDTLQPVFTQEEMDAWNSDAMLFPILTRRPPWVHGGNRPGWLDPQCYFVGQVFLRLGVHSEQARSGALAWSLGDEHGTGQHVEVEGCVPTEVAQVSVEIESPGEYLLSAEFDGVHAEWPIWVVPKPDWRAVKGWSFEDPAGLLEGVDLPGGNHLLTTKLDDRALDRARGGARIVAILQADGTEQMPFWRECAFEFSPGLLDLYRDRYERLWAVASDRALDPAWLQELLGDFEILMNRVDTRTYKENPYAVRADVGKGSILILALRPHGMLGAQPYGVDRNPAGSELLRRALSEEGFW